jgi:hypothetical protein
VVGAVQYFDYFIPQCEKVWQRCLLSIKIGVLRPRLRRHNDNPVRLLKTQ